MSIAQFYHAWIDWITRISGTNDSVLHINAGLAILFGTRLLLGRRLDTMIPLTMVVIAETINETLDRLFFGSWRWQDTANDVFNTLLWPVLISLAALLRYAMAKRAAAGVQALPEAEERGEPDVDDRLSA